MKKMKRMKIMKGRASDPDVAARLRRARSVADSDQTRPFEVRMRSCRSLSATDRCAAAGGGHVRVVGPLLHGLQPLHALHVLFL
jgi:hypothetical protein